MTLSDDLAAHLYERLPGDDSVVASESIARDAIDFLTQPANLERLIDGACEQGIMRLVGWSWNHVADGFHTIERHVAETSHSVTRCSPVYVIKQEDS